LRIFLASRKPRWMRVPWCWELPEKLHERALEQTLLLLKTIGKLMITIGMIENETGKKIEDLYKDVLSPEALSMIIKYAPPELLGKLFSIFFKMNLTFSKIRNISSLTPEEKINYGNELLKETEEAENILKEIKEYFAKKTEEDTEG
jgi:hypothetical protein